MAKRAFDIKKLRLNTRREVYSIKSQKYETKAKCEQIPMMRFWALDLRLSIGSKNFC